MMLIAQAAWVDTREILTSNGILGNTNIKDRCKESW